MVGIVMKYLSVNSQQRTFNCSKCAQTNNPLALDENDLRLMPTVLQDRTLSFVEEQLIAFICVNQYVFVRKTGAIAT